MLHLKIISLNPIHYPLKFQARFYIQIDDVFNSILWHLKYISVVSVDIIVRLWEIFLLNIFALLVWSSRYDIISCPSMFNKTVVAGVRSSRIVLAYHPHLTTPWPSPSHLLRYSPDTVNTTTTSSSKIINKNK